MTIINYCESFQELKKVTISNFFNEINPESPLQHHDGIKKQEEKDFFKKQ